MESPLQTEKSGRAITLDWSNETGGGRAPTSISGDADSSEVNVGGGGRDGVGWLRDSYLECFCW